MNTDIRLIICTSLLSFLALWAAQAQSQTPPPAQDQQAQPQKPELTEEQKKEKAKKKKQQEEKKGVRAAIPLFFLFLSYTYQFK